MKKARNWGQYNESLVNRSRVAFWFLDDVLKLWNHDNRDYRRGRPFIYSDTAIETLPLVREVFHLTCRGAEGVGRDAFMSLGVQDSRIPDYSSICKRLKTLNVFLKARNKREPFPVVVDSAGLKAYGEGEWKVKKHGKFPTYLRRNRFYGIHRRQHSRFKNNQRRRQDFLRFKVDAGRNRYKNNRLYFGRN